MDDRASNPFSFAVGLAAWLLLPAIAFAVLAYGNFSIYELGVIARRVSRSPQMFLTLSEFLIHSVQNIVIILCLQIVSARAVRGLGRMREWAEVLLMPAVIIALRFVCPRISPMLEIHFPMRGLIICPLLLLFQLLTLNVRNVLDRTFALMLWVLSFQSIEIISDMTSLPEVFSGEFGSDINTAFIGVTGFVLFLCFLAGAVSASWLLARSSARLSMLNDSWISSFGHSGGAETAGLHEVTMIDIGNVAHDLKNPIAVIKGTARMIERDSPSEKTALIIKAAQYMEDMVGELLTDDTMHEMKLGEFIKLVGSHARTFPWYAQTDITSSREADEAVVRMNRVRLLRALLNIIDNAWRSNENAGRSGISVNFSLSSEDTIAIEVIDNGTGFRRRILSESGTETGGRSGWGSTGMGLMFTRRIISLHGGTLLTANRQDGGGARVVIYLKTAGE